MHTERYTHTESESWSFSRNWLNYNVDFFFLVATVHFFFTNCLNFLWQPTDSQVWWGSPYPRSRREYVKPNSVFVINECCSPKYPVSPCSKYMLGLHALPLGLSGAMWLDLINELWMKERWVTLRRCISSKVLSSATVIATR